MIHECACNDLTGFPLAYQVVESQGIVEVGEKSGILTAGQHLSTKS